MTNISDRNQRIIDDYLGVGADKIMHSAPQLAVKYGVSTSGIYVILRHGGVEIRDKSSRGDISEKPFSPLHGQIGMAIHKWEITMFGKDTTKAPEFLNVTKATLNKWKAGRYDFTLSQLVQISNVIGVQLANLVTERNLVTIPPTSTVLQQGKPFSFDGV